MIIIPNKELEEEIELLQNHMPQSKEYFRARYQLAMKRRKKERRSMIVIEFPLILILFLLIVYALSRPQIDDSSGLLMVIVIATVSIVPALLLGRIIFYRKYKSSEDKYSRHIKLQLGKQYHAQQKNDA